MPSLRALALLLFSAGRSLCLCVPGSIILDKDCPPPPPSSPSNAPRSPPPPINACFSNRGWGEHGAGFRGSVSMTASFRKCQPWSRQYPQKWSTHLPLGLGTDTPYVSNYCRNVEPPTNAMGRPDAEQASPWCYTEDPEVRWEVCEVCNQPERLLRAVEAPHRHPHVPHWFGPLMFAFSILTFVGVLIVGVIRRYEIDVSKYFDVFGQDVSGRVIRMTRMRPRANPSGGRRSVREAQDGREAGPIGSSLSSPGCGGTAPLVAPLPSRGITHSEAATRSRTAQEATFGALASLANLQQQRNATGIFDPTVNPMVPGGTEQRRAAGQSLLANDSAAISGSVISAPPILEPDTTANKLGDNNV